VIRYSQKRLLSPALSSIFNEGEGVRVRTNHVAGTFGSGNVRVIPSSRSEAKEEVRESLLDLFKALFVSYA
jgi:hypothetical protein